MGKGMLAAFAAIAAWAVLAGSALGITGGQLDSSNTYSNVGALYATAPGHPVQLFCSGTLVRPGVFLTAAHCIAAIQSAPGAQMYVTFASDPGPTPAMSSLIPATSFAVDPLSGSKNGAEHDIAVVSFDASRASGIAPVAIAPANYLDAYMRKSLKSLSFLNVGYGLTSAGGTVDSLRRYAYGGDAKLKDANLVLSQKDRKGLGGTCTGDSGGPQFLDGYQISITITGDKNCTNNGVDLRLDSGSGRAFLQSVGVV